MNTCTSYEHIQFRVKHEMFLLNNVRSRYSAPASHLALEANSWVTGGSSKIVRADKYLESCGLQSESEPSVWQPPSATSKTVIQTFKLNMYGFKTLQKSKNPIPLVTAIFLLPKPDRRGWWEIEFFVLKGGGSIPAVDREIIDTNKLLSLWDA